MPDLFDADPTAAPGPRRAPRALNPAELRALAAWAEQRCPWISRGALGSLTPLDEYVDQCLSYFRSTTKRRPGWLETVQNWIRRAERERLERMARAGSASARLALTHPSQWAAQHDRVGRLVGPQRTEAPVLVRPADAPRVVQLTAPRVEREPIDPRAEF